MLARYCAKAENKVEVIYKKEKTIDSAPKSD